MLLDERNNPIEIFVATVDVEYGYYDELPNVQNINLAKMTLAELIRNYMANCHYGEEFEALVEILSDSPFAQYLEERGFVNINKLQDMEKKVKYKNSFKIIESKHKNTSFSMIHDVSLSSTKVAYKAIQSLAEGGKLYREVSIDALPDNLKKEYKKERRRFLAQQKKDQEAKAKRRKAREKRKIEKAKKLLEEKGEKV